MGIAERRKTGELREQTIPERERTIDEQWGIKLKFEVDWDSMSDSIEALQGFDEMTYRPLSIAFNQIAQDKVGQEALRDGLKTIKCRNVQDLSEKKLEIREGVLEMHCAYSKCGTLHYSGAAFTGNEIRDFLMKNL